MTARSQRQQGAFKCRRSTLTEYLDFHENPVLPCARSGRAYYRRLCEYPSISIRNRDISSQRANFVLDIRRVLVPARESELRGMKPPPFYGISVVRKIMAILFACTSFEVQSDSYIASRR